MSRYYYVTENEYRIFGESVFTAMGFPQKTAVLSPLSYRMQTCLALSPMESPEFPNIITL